MRKVRKTGGRRVGRTDGDPDGLHHTIIHPVWRRAYKNMKWKTNIIGKYKPSNVVLCSILQKYLISHYKKLYKINSVVLQNLFLYEYLAYA